MNDTLLQRATTLDTLGHQALVEHQILELVTSALRLSLQWQVSTVGMAKKLSSVRFTAQSFQRHLERLLTLEEGGGYMQFVRDRQPSLYSKALALRHEHDEFRESLTRILMALEGLSPHESECFDELCHNLETLLDRLDQHHRNEIDMVQEALLRDDGGEG